MPKRGNKGGGGNRNWRSEGGGREGKYYYEHDDRVGDSNRRVTFKQSANRNGKQNARKLNFAVRSQLEDDDVDMGGSSSLNRERYNAKNYDGGSGGNRRRPGRGSPPLPNQFRRRFTDNSLSWFKVLIPYGAQYTREYILKTLTSYIAPETFVPLCYQTQGIDASFYVEDAKVAEKLASADRKMITPKGFKLLVKVRAALPHVELNAELKTKIKAAMEKRYNPQTKALDLSKFHADPDLVDTCVMALFRPNLMIGVIDILAEHVPDLVALNLSENKLYSLEHLSILAEKLPHLKALRLSKNRIREIHQLNSLQSLKLEELVLDANPVCDRFKEQSIYISEVRKRFPKIIKLDNVDLPPPIVFDVNEDFKTPPSQTSYMVSENGMPVIRLFLEQYYQIFDSDNRQPLIHAYHENATFSLTCTYPPGQSSTNGPKLANYVSDSRNLIRVRDANRRERLLYRGRLDIVSMLSKLPKTQHNPLSFSVDLSICTPQIMMMTVTGLFLEPGPGRNQPLRSFTRVFVIIPFGDGYVIINDMLFVTNATDDQMKASYKNTVSRSEQVPAMPSAPAPIPAPAPVPVPVQTSPNAAFIDENTKQQMIEAFALQSGMNLEWARKCLVETEWNYDRASAVFSDLNKQGVIPAQAFIK